MSVTFKLARERKPGTPWELGDRLLITYVDEHGREPDPSVFVCTSTHDGRLIEAVSDTNPLVILRFDIEETRG